MELLKLSLKYPKTVTTRNKEKILSPILLSKKFTKTDLIEILTSLDAINFFETTKGDRASFQLVVKYIEWLLNIDLARPHERRAEVLGRKIDLTRMIKRMEKGIIEKSQE